MMGCYLEVPAHTQQAQQLVDQFGATHIPEPESYAAIPPEHVAICVVETGAFDAACVCYNNEEFLRWKYDESDRPRTWLVMERQHVRRLVGVRWQTLL